MGQEWDLLKDTISPIKYLSPTPNVCGKVEVYFNKFKVEEVSVTQRLIQGFWPNAMMLKVIFWAH